LDQGWIKVGSRLDHFYQNEAKLVLTTENSQKEMNAHQRAGSVSIWLYKGAKLPTEVVAQLTGLTWHGAEYMMNLLSAKLPIVKIEGLWQWAGRKDDN
jgi:hypothetical protein